MRRRPSVSPEDRPEDQPLHPAKGFTVANDTRTPKNSQPEPAKPPRRRAWQRHALTGAAVVGVVATAFAYPPAAMPLGLGLAALQLLRHNGRDE